VEDNKPAEGNYYTAPGVPYYNESVWQRLQNEEQIESVYFSGWANLIIELEQALAVTDPNFMIREIASELGVLKFSTTRLSPQGRDLVEQAKTDSASICADCNNTAVLKKLFDDQLLMTLCGPCFRRRRKPIEAVALRNSRPISKPI